ncbi:hypothetical protein JCM6882_000537 [Rhodosporidiobolus microsporus]
MFHHTSATDNAGPIRQMDRRQATPYPTYSPRSPTLSPELSGGVPLPFTLDGVLPELLNTPGAPLLGRAAYSAPYGNIPVNSSAYYTYAANLFDPGPAHLAAPAQLVADPRIALPAPAASARVPDLEDGETSDSSVVVVASAAAGGLAGGESSESESEEEEESEGEEVVVGPAAAERACQLSMARKGVKRCAPLPRVPTVDITRVEDERERAVLATFEPAVRAMLDLEVEVRTELADVRAEKREVVARFEEREERLAGEARTLAEAITGTRAIRKTLFERAAKKQRRE